MVEGKHVIAVGASGVSAHADRVFVHNAPDVASAFSRGAYDDLLVAQPLSMVYAIFPYGIESGLVRTSGVGTWSVTQVSGMAKLTTGSGATDRAVMHTTRALRFIPSQGIDVKVTPVYTSGLTTQLQMVGAINDYDGYAFGMSGSVGGIFHRAFGNTTFIPQSSWNINQVSGLDWSMGNVFRIQAQSLGFGRIRFSTASPTDGSFLACHDIIYTNRARAPSLSNAAMKLRAEVNNNGAANPISLYVAAIDGRTEGYDGLINAFAISGAGQTSGDMVHVLTLRNNPTYYGKENQRPMHISYFSAAIVGNNEAFIDLYKNLPGLSGTAYADVDSANSTASISIAGQLPLVTSGAVEGAFVLRNTISAHDLTRQVELTPGDTLTFVCRRTAGTAVPIYINVHFEEHI